MILHLTTRENWHASQQQGFVTAESLTTDGFIHCSTEHQILAVANKYYSGSANMVLLLVDLKNLTAPIEWEPPAHIDGSPAKPHEPLFPHIYGEINLSAVTRVIDFPCDKAGKFAMPPELQTFAIKPLATLRHHWSEAAQLSHAAWRHEFPFDTPSTYLDQFALDAATPGALPEIFAAVSPTDELLGLASLVADDELPGATEPGPWLAAVFVAPEVRSRGTGSALVHHIVERCRQRGDATLYLYTDEKQSWYESMGWTFIRQATLNDITHVVMYIATD